MKKILTLTILVIISLMNITMRPVYNTTEIHPEDNYSESSVFEGHQPHFTHNPPAGGWNGKLTFEFTRHFHCNYQGGTIDENENREQKIELRLSVEDIVFGKSPVARIVNPSGSGTIDIEYSYRKQEKRKGYYKLETADAGNSLPVSEKCLAVMLIQKKMSESPEAMMKRFEQLAQTNPMQLANEVHSMNKPDDKNGFGIDVVIEITGSWPTTVTSRTVVRSDDENKDDSRSEERDIALPMAVKLNGTISMNSDGSGTIIATYTGSEDTPNGKPSSTGCPPYTNIITCTLTLSK